MSTIGNAHMTPRAATIAVLAAVMGILAATSVVAGQESGGRAATKDAKPTASFGQTAVPARVSAFARIRPRNGVLVLAGPTTDYSFRIKHLDVREGEMVKAGQPLVELDVKAERAAKLAVAEAQVQEASVAAKFAARELSRKERLSAANAGAISVQDLDTARKAAESTGAALAVAKRRQAYAQVMLEQATIRAPVAGMVLHILKHEGEGVGAGNGLMELGQVAHMEALADVFETSIRYVKAGQRATFESPALTHPVKGKVLRIVPKVNRVSLYSTNPAENTEARVVRVVVALGDDPAVRTLSGLQGTILIDTASGN
jgi:HlyD family secretion protein